MEVDLDKIDSVVLRRLIEEIRQEAEDEEWEETRNNTTAYTRIHNRHNRSVGPYNRVHNRHNRGR